MAKLNKDFKGFALVEVLLVILTLIIIGVAGYFVAKHIDKKPINTTSSNTTPTQAIKKSTNASTSTSVDPTANWTVYSNVKGQFSLRYPTNWVQAASPQLCSDGLVLLGPNTGSVGHCASEGFGEVYVSSSAGDSRSDHNLGKGYTNITKDNITIANVNGVRESGTAMGQQTDQQALGGLPDNTRVALYIFYTNGKTYVAEYNQTPSYPDVLSDFNLLVTKTLKFSS